MSVERHTCSSATERAARLKAAVIADCAEFQCVVPGCEKKTRKQFEVHGDWHVPLCHKHRKRATLEDFYPKATG